MEHFHFGVVFLSGGKRIIPSMIIHGRNNPLRTDIEPFVMTDEGLHYETNHEKIKRLNITNLISF